VKRFTRSAVACLKTGQEVKVNDQRKIERKAVDDDAVSGSLQNFDNSRSATTDPLRSARSAVLAHAPQGSTETLVVRSKFETNQRQHAAAQELVIEAGRHERHYWRDLWRYRELFRVLAWRDIAVRYKQTIIGAAWALIRPLLTMVIFTIVFGRLANLSANGSPYAILVFSGMLPWTLFSTALADASNSLVSNANLISKIYFPRLIVPAAAIAVSLVDFLISLAILVGLMFWYRYTPGYKLLFLPLFTIMAFIASLGPALWISALNVKYRDFRYVVPFILQLGLYVSPVGYSSSVVPAEWRLLFSLNPIVGIIDGFRWCILSQQQELYAPSLCLSMAVTCLLLWFGLRQFRKLERSFADII